VQGTKIILSILSHVLKQKYHIDQNPSVFLIFW